MTVPYYRKSSESALPHQQIRHVKQIPILIRTVPSNLDRSILLAPYCIVILASVSTIVYGGGPEGREGRE